MQLASAPQESSGQNKRTSMAVQAAPAPAGDSLLVSRFLPTRELSNNNHNPTSHHECKNTRHRDSAPTPHTAERYAKFYTNLLTFDYEKPDSFFDQGKPEETNCINVHYFHIS